MAKRTPRRRKRWGWYAGIILLIVAIAPSYVRAHRVGGSSDAPTYLLGDLIFVNKAAYDIRLPYLDAVILSHSEPRRGEVVLYVPPDRTYRVFKRVVGIPGDTIAMRKYHLTVNGEALQYEPTDRSKSYQDMEKNKIGAVVEHERGNGVEHLITYTPGASEDDSFESITIPEGHYYVLGDNRSNSRDSRMYGPIPRESIIGRVGRPFRAQD